MRKLKITASHIVGGSRITFTVQGQTARSLKALIEAGDKGVTALEVSTWALRFAAYCHDLKHKFGLNIRTDREQHDSGWHGRHVLETQVEIVEMIQPEPNEAA